MFSVSFCRCIDSNHVPNILSISNTLKGPYMLNARRREPIPIADWYSTFWGQSNHHRLVIRHPHRISKRGSMCDMMRTTFGQKTDVAQLPEFILFTIITQWFLIDVDLIIRWPFYDKRLEFIWLIFSTQWLSMRFHHSFASLWQEADFKYLIIST